jgi:hypothetical protein
MGLRDSYVSKRALNLRPNIPTPTITKTLTSAPDCGGHRHREGCCVR